MYLYIVYKDGSNPFYMVNATAAAIQKELEYQLSPWNNLYNIDYFSINGNVTKINAVKMYTENVSF